MRRFASFDWSSYAHERHGILARYDFYVLERLLILFLLLSGILIALNWINLTIRGFADLVSDAQAFSILLRYALFALPNSILKALALAAFAASVYVAYRMSTDREMAVLQASGASPARLLRPFLAFGVLAMLLASVLVHKAVPESKRENARLRVEIQTDVTQIRVKAGSFFFPLDRTAVFVGGVDEDGAFRNVFIHYARDRGDELTYYADTGRILTTLAGPILELSEGSTHFWNPEVNSLAQANYESARLNLSKFTQALTTSPPTTRQETTAGLLRRMHDPAMQEIGADRGFLVEIQHRLARSFSAALFPFIGAAAIAAGSASRGRRVLAIIISLVVVIILQLMIDHYYSKARSGEASAFMVHLPLFLGLIFLSVSIVGTGVMPPGLRRWWNHRTA
ncbi:MAG: LptF/LptG family permease [Rhodobacteraceae bacterium]|nr:LptF/LptG family permease [Paracoccaceae bacterium]